MIGVGLAVYFFTAKSEQEDFQLHFAQDAHKVLEAVGGSLDLTLKAVDVLAVSMVVRLEIQKFKKCRQLSVPFSLLACPLYSFWYILVVCPLCRSKMAIRYSARL
jgi:hypothetical protein